MLFVINIFLDNGLLYIAMGFCEGGDLYTKLKEQKGKPLEERQIVEWYVQISMALQASIIILHRLPFNYSGLVAREKR